MDEIIAQHGLEHLPQRSIERTLRHWFDILAPGGTLELGVPDIELCMKWFLENTEGDQWTKAIYTIYGCQMSDQVINPTEDEPFELGQVHMSGHTLKSLTDLLVNIGYEIIDSYNYDGYGTPSAFVFARKPLPDVGACFTDDVVMGTFTNRTTYLPALLDSVKKYLSNVPFIVKVNDGPININMELLRQDFLATNKRYWIFLDDDIQFLHKDTIKDAIKALIQNKWAAAHVYSTFDPDWIKNGYNVSGLQLRETKWATGYFILVDSTLVGDIVPDQNLPDGNTAVDTSYSVEIRKRGYRIGIVPHVVYHTKKDTKVNDSIIEVTNKYLMGKYGQFYFDVAQYDNNVLEWKV
jgi:hypothetical protein